MNSAVSKQEITHVSLELARFLRDKKSPHVTVLDVAEKTQFVDTFLLITGQSLLHIQGLQSYAIQFLEERGYKKRNPSNMYLDSPWILLDFGDIIVHLFTQEAREFYQLEKIWAGSLVLFDEVDLENSQYEGNL